MSNRIQSFRAATIDEAMYLVRCELGNDAVVLDSKEVATRRLLPWPKTHREIEVRAESVRRSSKSKKVRHQPENVTTKQRTLQTLAELQRSSASQSTLLAPVRELGIDSDEEVPKISDQISRSSRTSNRDKSMMEPSDWSTGDRTDFRQSESTSQVTLDAALFEADSGQSSRQEIASQLSRHGNPLFRNEIRQELHHAQWKLIEAGVEEDLASELVTTVHRQSISGATDSPEAMATMLTAMIEREMRCTPPIQPRPGRREIVTLIGPTGVGKTTTLAKLAGHFQLREGRRVGLITVDHYRVGAIEQLQTYADILQVPLRTASSPDELRNAIDEFDDVDVILIDTAGRSPADRGKQEELCDLVRATVADHVLLVLSVAGGAKSLPKIAESFASAMPTSLVLTKLDEAMGCGGLMTIARHIPIPVSYLTTGQDVPDQIEPAHPTRLARLIMGRDSVTSNHE